MIFVGSESIFNITAIQWFLNKVLPLLTKKPKIAIIGRVCKHIGEYNNIDKIMFVENLADYYNKSRVAICPMLEGTGIKIKVVEALSYGLPVIGTEKAIDGFFQKVNNGCIIADNEQDFAEAITAILNNPTLYEQKKNEVQNSFNKYFSINNSRQLWQEAISLTPKD